jgi:hypothetical protein
MVAVVVVTQVQQATQVALVVAVAGRAVLAVLAIHLQLLRAKVVMAEQGQATMVAAAVEHPSQATPMEHQRVAMELHPQSPGHR